MLEEIKKGLYIGFGIFLSLGILFGIVYAVGFHSADEITSGSFIGNFDFSTATVTGLPTTNLQKSNTSICNLANEGDLRYNPTSKSYEGCYNNSWGRIKKLGCDYEINGKCWVIVWKATENNIFSSSYSYNDVITASQATAFAFGYVDSTGTLSQTYYTIDNSVISMFRIKHPFEYVDVNTNTNMYDINTDASSSGLFKCGSHSFSHLCSDASNTGAVYGRVCFTGNSNFPYYNGFGVAVQDYCTDSNLDYAAQSCTDEKRFIILAKIN